MAKRWDCHKHRDELRVSDEKTIYHLGQGQLCYYELHYDVILYYPIVFKSKESAYKWIERGTIAELQEGLGDLHVKFSTVLIEERDDFQYENNR